MLEPIEPELRSRPLVFVDDLELLELDAGDRSHLERSLRIRVGEMVTAADGTGRYRAVRFGESIEADGPIVTSAKPAPALTVGFALVKGDRSDLVVQKLTELGIDTIVPLHTERSVVRWDEKRTAKNLERHRRIVREAAMQSRNLWPPTVEPFVALSDFLATRPAASFADPGGAPMAGTESTIVIGPEGGFAPGELSGRQTVSFPGRILRTETAAITAGVLLAAGRANHSARP